MNLRCTYCQTPFTVGRLDKLAALQRMLAEDLHHYDAVCPRCRRANSVSRERLQIFTPGWREGLKTLEAEAAQADITALVPPVVAAIPVAATVSVPPKKRHAPKPAMDKPAAAKPVPAKAKPAAKKPAMAVKPAPAKAKKPAPAKAKKPAPAKAKPAAKKPAAKKPAAKAKKPAVRKK